MNVYLRSVGVHSVILHALSAASSLSHTPPLRSPHPAPLPASVRSQFFRMRRLQLYAAARTWLYPSAPPPFAPLGDGTISNHVLSDEPMSLADCAEAGLRDRGCKQRIPGKGWVGEWDKDNRFAITVRIAGAIWREITTVAAMGREETMRRRVLRDKVYPRERICCSRQCCVEARDMLCSIKAEWKCGSCHGVVFDLFGIRVGYARFRQRYGCALRHKGVRLSID